MRINCHAHVFNLPAVFNQQTIQTLINRLLVMAPHVLTEEQIHPLIADLLAAGANDNSPAGILAG